MLHKEITRESYQLTAHEYAKNVTNLASVNSIKRFINLLPLKAKIIDLGSGSGRDAKLLSAMGAEVIGIDYCSNLIDIAAQHAPLANFQLQDIETMNFSAELFDGAWAACTLGHFPKKDLMNVLKKIHLILKSEGYFYLSLKKGTGEGLEKDTRYDGNIMKYWAYYEKDELLEMLEAAQFNVLELSLIEKSHPYHTRDAFRVFCQKV